MKRTTVYRIRCRGLGLVPGVYATTALAQQHAHEWHDKDIALHGVATPKGSAFGVIAIEPESFYVEGEGSEAKHPCELPSAQPSQTRAPDALPGLVISATGTVTNP